ncbi:MAG: DUF488 domain-containing protein [Acidobacteriota bacterium]
MIIHTIGHSTHSAEAFLRLLTTHGIRQVADIRTIPGSRRYPHFGREVMDGWLAAAGVAYRHFPSLGGRRRPRADSINTAVRHPSFRGYADYMQTDEFRSGVDALHIFAQSAPTTVMCAEAVWWRCHRRLLSDALLVRGVTVLHILSAASAKPHELSEFGRVEGGRVTYRGLL